MACKKETSCKKTPAQQNEKLTEKDLINVAKELSDDELNDVSGGLGEAIIGEAG